jgi:hypothetical protein
VKPYRWMTKRGEQTADLVALIARARTGERWDDIAATFYPGSGNGIRKACDTFTRYASAAEKRDRRDALACSGFNRRRGPQNQRALYGGVEPPLRREQSDPWDGMGACFANHARA